MSKQLTPEQRARRAAKEIVADFFYNEMVAAPKYRAVRATRFIAAAIRSAERSTIDAAVKALLERAKQDDVDHDECRACADIVAALVPSEYAR